MNETISLERIEEFHGYLNDYQEDLVKIIGAHRYNFHYLDNDELLSDVNLSLIKKRDDILEQLGDEFNRVEFQKIAYNYTRNCIKWSHGRRSRVSYYSKRTDTVHEGEDGPKTTFEMLEEPQGVEEEYYESFD